MCNECACGVGLGAGRLIAHKFMDFVQFIERTNGKTQISVIEKEKTKHNPRESQITEHNA